MCPPTSIEGISWEIHRSSQGRNSDPELGGGGSMPERSEAGARRGGHQEPGSGGAVPSDDQGRSTGGDPGGEAPGKFGFFEVKY